MVLAKLYTDRVREEARVEGHKEGRQEGLAEDYKEGQREGAKLMLTRWQEWNRCRQAAEQAGHPFNEPEPNLD